MDADLNPLLDSTAAGQLGGYLYQIERALVRLMTLREGQTLWIEVLEDFHVSNSSTDAELAQVKHHMGDAPPRLTDGSRDLWKPLSIWAKAILQGFTSIVDCHFMLYTNSAIPNGSIAELLNGKGRTDDALSAIRNKPLPKDDDIVRYMNQVRKLTDSQLIDLISRTEIVGDCPSLSESTEELKDILRSKTFHTKTCDDAVNILRGWFFSILYKRLGKSTEARVTENEVHEFLSSLRDSLINRPLPVYPEVGEVEIPDVATMTTFIFVQQLQAVAASGRVQQHAAKQYLKARNLRSRWLMEAKILPDQLSIYDEDLIDRWQTLFDYALDDVQGEDDLATLQSKGASLYRSIQVIDVSLQTDVPVMYLTNGSYHLLADKLRVGWHPRYLDMFVMPLKTAGGT